MGEQIIGGIKPGLAVIAIGGNSLIRDAQRKRISDQFEVTRETCQHIQQLIETGWRVVITHGNGPQVGFLLRRCELSLTELHPLPMPMIGASIQGSMGYMLQQCLGNRFVGQQDPCQVATVLTQVRVDADDPAFDDPTKPIGSFMDEVVAKRRIKEEGWNVKEDAGRGWRRVVPSPRPMEIVEFPVIRALVDEGFIVIAAGGGGVPVIRKEPSGLLRGVAAVIDKDFTSALLAKRLKADLFVISTAVDGVYLDFGKATQRCLSRMTLAQAKQYAQEGQFPQGSMGPKMAAVIDFLDQGGKTAIVTRPEEIVAAVQGKAGTWIQSQAYE